MSLKSNMKSEMKGVRIIITEDEEKPSPCDFETFYPWACLEYESPVIPTIIKTIIDTNKSDHGKKTAKRSHSKDKVVKSSLDKKQEKYDSNSDVAGGGLVSKVYTVFDQHDNLIQITYGNFDIPRVLTQVLGIVIQFYPNLSKLKYCNSGIDLYLVHELKKILPNSNISEIYFENCFLPEMNYFDLLMVKSNLSYLSLCRCDITDEALKILCSCLQEENHLKLKFLNLTSNRITDIGASYLGTNLRRNRTLCYLNLAENQISDLGCYDILKVLMEFSLTCDELIERRHNYLSFCEKKKNVYDDVLRDIQNLYYQSAPRPDSVVSKGGFKRNIQKKKTHKGNKSPKVDSDADGIEMDTIDFFMYKKAELLAKDLVGDFDDPFSYKNTISKDGLAYCVGNTSLKYLNLSYNHLEVLSLRYIFDVINYQHNSINTDSGNEGLIKIIIEGNSFPEDCEELRCLQVRLNKPTSGEKVIKKRIK